jgi:hypothetical protein
MWVVPINGSKLRRMFKMKKSLVFALTGMFVVGATATTFAAPNPFSDVPAGHWAYDAVSELAKDGIIEGYGDGTFRGNRSITRYEMAQMVARALAKKNSSSSHFSGDGSGMSEEEVRAIVEEYSLTPEEVRTIVEEYFNEGGSLAPEEVRAIVEDYLNENESGALTVEEVRNLIDDRLNGRSGMTAEDAKKIEARFNRHEMLLNKLKEEFGAELENLGVRVEELEKHADMVKWTGKIEYTYGQLKNKDTGSESTGNGGVFRLEPVAEVNDNWKAVARFDAGFDMKHDEYNDVKLKRVYAEADYDKFGLKLGRFGYCPAEDGLAVDTCVSGAEISFGSKWKFVAAGGRIGAASDEAHGDQFGEADPTDLLGVNIQYDPGASGLFGGGSWYMAKDDDYKFTPLYGGKDEDNANIWAANLGYRTEGGFTLKGSYGRNDKAQEEKDGWQVLARVGNYGDYSEQGDWAVWAGYSKFGQGLAIASNKSDDVQKGTKGWHVGVAYAPFKNVGVIARYADGKYITSGDKFRKVFVRGEWFF